MRWEKIRAKTRSGEETCVELAAKRSPGRKGGSLGPGKRWGHTCNAVKNGRCLYVFGGYGKDNCQTNDVHVFDPSRQIWIKPMCKGNPPTPRDSHSCTTVGSCLFIFGGTDGQNPLNDLVVLDTSTNSWIEPKVHGTGPDAREGHSAALVGNRLFVFGGCGKVDDAEEVYFNDLHILDTNTMTWTKARTSGTPPSPRDSHTCSSWKNKIIVIGGEDSTDSYLADVHMLNADTLVWEVVKTTGQQMTPRAGHCTVALGKHLFVFGGFTDDRSLFDDLHILNLETRVWTKAPVTGFSPSSRFSVAGDCLDYRRGILVFIGGCNENLEALDDLYYLHTDMISENESEEHKPEKLSLRKELKRKRQEHCASYNFERMKEAPSDEGMPMHVFHQPVFPQQVFMQPPMASSLQSHASPGMDRMSLYDFKAAEDKIFEARITDVFHYGYTIESNIDGHQLRGLLFSYKPGFAHAVHGYLNRRNMAPESSTGRCKETQKPKLKIARPPKQTIKRDDQHIQSPVTAQPAGIHIDSSVLQRADVGSCAQSNAHLQSAPSSSGAVHGPYKSDIGSGYDSSLPREREFTTPLASSQERPSDTQTPTPMPALQETCLAQVGSMMQSQVGSHASESSLSVISSHRGTGLSQTSPVMPVADEARKLELSSTMVPTVEGTSSTPAPSKLMSAEEQTCASQISSETAAVKENITTFQLFSQVAPSQEGAAASVPVNSDPEPNHDRTFDLELHAGDSAVQKDYEAIQHHCSRLDTEVQTVAHECPIEPETVQNPRKSFDIEMQIGISPTHTVDSEEKQNTGTCDFEMQLDSKSKQNQQMTHSEVKIDSELRLNQGTLDSEMQMGYETAPNEGNQSRKGDTHLDEQLQEKLDAGKFSSV